MYYGPFLPTVNPSFMTPIGPTDIPAPPLDGAGFGSLTSFKLTGQQAELSLEFPDYATALACYRSPEYQENIKVRLPHATADIIIIEGYDGPQPSDG